MIRYLTILLIVVFLSLTVFASASSYAQTNQITNPNQPTRLTPVNNTSGVKGAFNDQADFLFDRRWLFLIIAFSVALFLVRWFNHVGRSQPRRFSRMNISYSDLSWSRSRANHSTLLPPKKTKPEGIRVKNLKVV